MMLTLSQVALGGALGAVARFLTGLAVAFPYGTLTVNVAGSFAIGLLWSLLVSKGMEQWIPFLMIGVLGGFTTFSAFSLDALRLIEAGRTGAAFAYVAASVALSLAACALGLWLASGITS